MNTMPHKGQRVKFLLYQKKYSKNNRVLATGTVIQTDYKGICTPEVPRAVVRFDTQPKGFDQVEPIMIAFLEPLEDAA